MVLQPLRLLLSRTIYFLLPPASHKTTIWPKKRGRRLEKGHQENSILPPLSCLQTVGFHTVIPELQSLLSVHISAGGDTWETRGNRTDWNCPVSLVHPAPQLVIACALCLQCPEAGPGPSQDLTGIGCLSPTSKLKYQPFPIKWKPQLPVSYNTLTSGRIHDFPYENDFQTLVHKRTTWGLVKMKTLGHTFSFSLSRSVAGPKDLHFNKFPGDANAVTTSGDYIENCCPRGKQALLLCQNIALKMHSST